MRMQDSQASCGVYAVKNALQALRIERTAAELEAMLGTTATDGTELKQIIRALQRIEGCKPVKIAERRADVAALKLEKALRSGRPAIILWTCDEPGDHWVAAFGLLGDTFHVADSANNELVLHLSAEEMIESWASDGYHGVIL